MTSPRNPTPHTELDPELRSTVAKLEQLAQQITPDPRFTARLQARLAAAHTTPEITSMFSIKKIAPALLWVLAAAITTLVIYWTVRSLAPEPVPAARNTPAATALAPVPPLDQPTPAPSAKSYDWNGTTLYVAAAMPDSPAEAAVYLGQPAGHATLEQALALAERFGIQGNAYNTPGEVPGTTDFLITDGRQSLRVRSADYFTYTADIIASYNNISAVQNADADSLIAEFLASHGFTFTYRVEWSDGRGGYVVQPISPDGTPFRYEDFNPPMLFVTLDAQGHVATLQASLMDVASEAVGRYGIVTADEAFARLLAPGDLGAMVLESMHAAPVAIHQWMRAYPAVGLDTAGNAPPYSTITIYGYASSLASAQAGQAAFVQIDGFPVSGQISGLEALPESTYVAATGQFVVESPPGAGQAGIKRFQVDSWGRADVNEDGLFGTLERKDGQVTLTTEDGTSLVLPDVPADVPMPFEKAFVVGTRRGDTFEWKLIDDRTQGGGGGGGGGGVGFYKLNLTGTPVPFPTPVLTSGAADGSQYVVQAGDTLGSIAVRYGTTVEELVKVNGLPDANSITVGEVLTVGGATPRRIEGLRGILSITINKLPDGSQAAVYGLMANADSDPGGYVLLDPTGLGNSLDALQAYSGRPVDIWGTMDAPQGAGIPTVNVERYEVPFPDLKVQVLQGTQRLATVAGQQATLFTTLDGRTFVQMTQDGRMGNSLIGLEGDQVELECVAIPGEAAGGYAALRMFGGMMAVDPKTGLRVNMPITADKPAVMEVPASGRTTEAPTATIERIELVHFTSDPRYAVVLPGAEPPYFQPVWRFTGHYSNGDEFEMLVQALRQEYLLPEVAPAIQPG